jgi:hypothetical protein
MPQAPALSGRCRQAVLDLCSGRIGVRRAVREQDSGNGAVAAVDLLHELGGTFHFLDVDFGVTDALRVKLLLQPVAVAAPGGGKHGDGAGFGSEIHRVLLWVG